MSQTTPCPTCGAPQAPDQRYCLSCGARVAAPRLDFVAETERAEAAARNGSSPGGAAAADGAAGAGDSPTAVLAVVAPGAAATPPSPSAAVPGAAATPPFAAVPIASPPAPSRLDRIGGPMGAAAVVLVALGVGFLVGQASNATPPRQQAPVVNIEGALPSGGAETPASDLPAAEETTDVPAAEDVPATEDAGATDGGADGSTVPPDDAAVPPAEDETAGGGRDAEAIG